jgi:hypothetical protein
MNPISISTCSGVYFSFTPTGTIVPNGTTYSWTLPSGGLGGSASLSNQASLNATLTNSTNTIQTATYTITPLSSGCTGAVFTGVVSVFPLAAVSNVSLSICSGASFTAALTGTIPSGTTYSWSAPTVTGGMTGGAPGTSAGSVTGSLSNTTSTLQTATYFVTPSVTGGCTSAGFTVTVQVLPTASINNVTLSICSGVGFTASLTGTIPSGTTYSWSAPNVTGGITGGALSSASSIVSGTLSNSTTTVGTAT